MKRGGQVMPRHELLEGCFLPGSGVDDELCPDWKPPPPDIIDPPDPDNCPPWWPDWACDGTGRPEESGDTGGDNSGGGGGITWPPFPDFPGFESTLYPMFAVVWYAAHDQDDFGHIKKKWFPDHIFYSNVSQTTNYKDQQITPDQIMIVEDILALQTLDDVRVDRFGGLHSMTDILISHLGYYNAYDRGFKDIYYESGGTRKGKPTLFEVSGVLPHNGFEGNDYFKVVISRSMHQELID